MLSISSRRVLIVQIATAMALMLLIGAGCGGNSFINGNGGLSADNASRAAQKNGDRPVSVPDASPREGGVPLEVSFWGEASWDPDGEIVKWEWNFSDQADGETAWEDYTATGGAAKHTYEHPGTQVAHLRVTDNDGNTDSAFVKIKMRLEGGSEDPPPDPPAQAWPMFGYAAEHIRRSPYVGSAVNHLLWSYNLGALQLLSSPAVAADGTIYVGATSSTNKLFAINPDGTFKWDFTTGWSVRSSPAIGSDGTIYFGCDDNNLYALNSDGTFKWTYQTGGDVFSSPTIGPDGTIYVGSWDGKLYALNSNGMLLWSYQTGGAIRSSPAVGNGMVYIGSDDNMLHAVDLNGIGQWTYDTGRDVRSSPAIGSDGTIYVGGYDGKLYALYPTGTLQWAVHGGGGPILSSPALATDGTIYIGIMRYDSGPALLAFNPLGGLKWQSITTSKGIYSSPTIGADGTIYVGCQDGKLYAVNSEGALVWSYPCQGDVDSSPAIGPNGNVYVASYNRLFAFGPAL